MYKLVFIFLFFISCIIGSKKKVNSQIQFERKYLDVGIIAYKTDIAFSFNFKNIATETVKIETVILSCSCLSAEISKTEICPQDSGRILIYTNTGRLGKFTERIIIHYSNTEYSDTLFLTGTIVFDDNNKK